MTIPEWKLTLKAEDAPPTPATFLTSWPKDAAKALDVGEDRPRVKQVHAYLESHDSSTGANKVNVHPVYAIIGCGFAATTNRATLQAEDIDGLEVVHIGFPDPWSGYVTHNMNQAQELLTVPGYKHQPPLCPMDKKTQERWLASNLFAECTKKERARFIKSPDKREIKASVKSIQIDDDSGYFKIILNGPHQPIIARRVDIVTGTGQQRILKPEAEDAKYGVDMTEALWLEYLLPAKVDGGATVPQVTSAEMYVRGNCRPKEDGLVCVTGASPAGIQAIEHALCEDGCPLPAAKGGVLVDSGSVKKGFLPIGRLDDHARDEHGQPLPLRQSVPAGSIYPSREHIWFAEGYRVKSIEPLTSQHLAIFNNLEQGDIDAKRVLVTFKTASTTRRLVSHAKEDGGELIYGKFDQVVLGSGRLRGGRGKNSETGSALDLVWDLRNDLVPIDVGVGFPVGLQMLKSNQSANDMRLRLLGAAGINNPRFAETQDELGCTPLGRYESFLPAHARVNGEGITLAGHTLAWANQFFTTDADKRNTNINTATLSELRALAPDLADTLYAARRRRVGPFISRRQTGHALEVFEYGRDKNENIQNKMAKATQIRDLMGQRQTVTQKKHLLQQNIFTLEQRAAAIPKDWPDIIESNSLRDIGISIKQAQSDIHGLQHKLKSIEEKIDLLKQVESGLKDTLSFIQFMNDDAWLFARDSAWDQSVQRRALAQSFSTAYNSKDWHPIAAESLEAFFFRPRHYLDRAITRTEIEDHEPTPYD